MIKIANAKKIPKSVFEKLQDIFEKNSVSLYEKIPRYIPIKITNIIVESFFIDGFSEKKLFYL